MSQIEGKLKNEKLTAEDVAKLIEEGDKNFNETKKKIEKEISKLKNKKINTEKDNKKFKKNLKDLEDIEFKKKEGGKRDVPKSLSKEQLESATPQELFDMGYSVHSTEITDAIKRMLKKNVWDKREKDNQKRPGDSKEIKNNLNTEQKKDIFNNQTGSMKNSKEKESDNNGTNTQGNPPPKKEAHKGDPYIELLKGEINKKIVELNTLKNKIEDPNTDPSLIDGLQAQYNQLNNDIINLQNELLTYRKKNKQGRATHSKVYNQNNTTNTGHSSTRQNPRSNPNSQPNNNSNAGPNNPVNNPNSGPRNPGNNPNSQPNNNNNAGPNGPRNPGNGPTSTPDSQFKIQLDALRVSYTSAYKQFYYHDRKLGLKNKLRKIVGAKLVNEPSVPQNLIDLKTQYEKALYEYGNDLYNQESTRLNGQNLSQDQIKSHLAQYKSEVIFKELIIDEEQKLAQQKVEDLPRKEKSAMRSFLSWYGGLNPVTRKAISIGVFTGIGVAAIATFGGGAAVAGAWGGAKILRSASGALVGEGAAYAIGRMASGEINRAKESGTDSSKNVLGNFNWDENTFLNAKNQYQRTLNQYAERMNSVRKKQMAAKIISGGLTTFALNYEDAFMHKPSSEDIWGNKEVDDGAGTTKNENSGDTKSSDNKGSSTGKAEQVIKTPEASDEIIKNVETVVSSEGSLATIDDLKDKLSAQFGDDLSKAPAHIRHIIETDKYTLSKEWGLFNPDDKSGEESAMMLKGSNITMDKNWNITLHDVGKGDTVLSGEGAKIYSGEMFDSDHQATEGGATKLADGEVDINQVPEGEDGYTKLADGEVDINQNPEGLGSNNLDKAPYADGLPVDQNELNKTVWQKENLNIKGNAYEDANGNIVRLDGKEVTLGSDHKIYVNGVASEYLTKELNFEKNKILDNASVRFFGWSGDGANSKEWLRLQKYDMSTLKNPPTEGFLSDKENNFIKRLLKEAARSGVDYHGKTASQLVEEMAIKKLG
jgi:hypothetical protein